MPSEKMRPKTGSRCEILMVTLVPSQRLWTHFASLLPSQEDGGDHDVPVFDEVPVGQFRDMTGFDPVYRGDPVTDKFYGRAVEVQKVSQLSFF